MTVTPSPDNQSHQYLHGGSHLSTWNSRVRVMGRSVFRCPSRASTCNYMSRRSKYQSSLQLRHFFSSNDCVLLKKKNTLKFKEMKARSHVNSTMRMCLTYIGVSQQYFRVIVFALQLILRHICTHVYVYKCLCVRPIVIPTYTGLI
jgi:hypothetical protein